jgi:hypothetical protein
MDGRGLPEHHDPSSMLAEGDSADFLADCAEQILDLLAKVLESANKGGKVLAARYRIGYAETVHKHLTGMLRLMAPLCLLRNTIAAYAGETPTAGGGGGGEKIAAAHAAVGDFLGFLAKRSSRRNSFSVVNFLNAGLGAMSSLAEAEKREGDMAKEALLGVLDNLMERKSLRWLTDFHDLTSIGSLHE